MQGKFIPGLLVIVALLGAASLRAADESSAPATQPSGDMAMPHHSRKLFEPYGMLSDLSDDQKEQIEKIHGDYLAQTKALREKQDNDIMGVLTSDQKTELQKDVDEAAAQRKEKSAERRKQKMMDSATTMPAK